METNNSPSETLQTKDVLTLIHLTKYFGKRRALLDVNLSFTPGITLIIGPPGVGKSTMLKIIAGKYRQSFGTVKVNGVDILHDEKRAKRYVGYVSEDPELPNDMTSIGLLEFVGVLCNDMERQQARLKAEKILNQLNLASIARRKISKLTNEERYLLYFIGELLRDTPVLLIDEPFKNVIEKKDLFINTIKSLAESKTVVITTSYLPPDLDYFSRILLFYAGIVVKEGTAKSLGFYNKLFRLKIVEHEKFLSLLSEKDVAKNAYSDGTYIYAEVEPEKLDVFNKVILEIANQLNIQIEEITSELIPFNKLLDDAIKEYEKGVGVKNEIKEGETKQ